MWKLTRSLLCAVMLGAAGCAGLSGGTGANNETLQAELTDYADEATRLADVGLEQRTQIAVTAAAAETYVGRVDGINVQLALTLRAAVPPTRQIVANSGPVTPGMIAPPEGQAMSSTDSTLVPFTEGNTQYTDVATALAIRESDGCAADRTSQFSTGVSRVYATARALNIAAGTAVYVEWQYAGARVAQSTVYTIASDDADFCLWFYLEPTDAPFSVGEWAAQFFADGAPAGTAAFTLG